MENLISFEEPVELKTNLPEKNPFGKSLTRTERLVLRDEIEEIRSSLSPLSDVILYKNGKNKIDLSFVRLEQEEMWERPPKGTDYPSHKLRIKNQNLIRTNTDLVSGYNALLRLDIAKKVQSNLKIRISIPEILAMYRTEGDLAIPLSILTMNKKLPPDKPLFPDFEFVNLFFWNHHVFFTEKKPNNPKYRHIINGICSTIKTREKIRFDLLVQKYGSYRFPPNSKGHGPLSWLNAAKGHAFTAYLSLIGGLDFYTMDYLSADDQNAELPKQLFSYNYARNRKNLDYPERFSELINKGIEVYEKVTEVKFEDFMNGIIDEKSIVSCIYKKGNNFNHFFMPYSPTIFSSIIIAESAIRLESFRVSPLICGGNGFREDPLPPSVAYIRYNAWDIYFIVIVLDTLERVLKLKNLERLPKTEIENIKKLKIEIKEFEEDPDVWYVLKKWRDKKSNYYPRTDLVRKRTKMILALLNDAKSLFGSYDFSRYPGINEINLKNELNSEKKGKLSSALPIIEKITKKHLWGVFEKVMVSHIGPKNQVWLGRSSTTKLGNEIGMNTLRFYYLLRAYEDAFNEKD